LPCRDNVDGRVGVGATITLDNRDIPDTSEEEVDQTVQRHVLQAPRDLKGGTPFRAQGHRLAVLAGKRHGRHLIAGEPTQRGVEEMVISLPLGGE